MLCDIEGDEETREAYANIGEKVLWAQKKGNWGERFFFSLLLILLIHREPQKAPLSEIMARGMGSKG